MNELDEWNNATLTWDEVGMLMETNRPTNMGPLASETMICPARVRMPNGKHYNIMPGAEIRLEQMLEACNVEFRVNDRHRDYTYSSDPPFKRKQTLIPKREMTEYERLKQAEFDRAMADQMAYVNRYMDTKFPSR